MKHCGIQSFCRLFYWSQFFTLPYISICLLPYDFAQGKTKCISLALNFGLGYVLDLSDGKGQKP